MAEHQDLTYSSTSTTNHKKDYIFDSNLIGPILKIYSRHDSKLHGNIYNCQYLIRPLCISDYDYGYIELLEQLTDCGKITFETFKERFYEMKQCLNTYYILVIEDMNSNKKIIGTTTLVCEKKFIHQLAIRGRIEDVVIHDQYRGQHLGKILVDLLTKFAKVICNCYKISLECKDHLINFYRQLGYDHEDKQNYLCQRFLKL